MSQVMVRRLCISCVLCMGLQHALPQDSRVAGKLLSSYYAKDWGVLEPQELEQILKKPFLSEDDVVRLSRLVSNRSSQRLQEIDRSIRGFSQGRGDQDDVVLLLSLKESLRDERAKILTGTIQYLQNPIVDNGRLRVLSNLATSAENKDLEAILGIVPGLLLNSEDDSVAVGFSMLEMAARRGLFSGENQQALYVEPIALALSKMAQSKDDMFVRPRSRLLLVKIGSEGGKQLVEEVIGKSTDPKADLTMLSDAMPETFQFFIAASTLPKIGTIERIGENIRRFDSEKLRGSFFNNCGILLRHTSVRL